MADQERREVTLATRVLGEDMIEIAVADIGPGISDDVADRLFKPFVQIKTLAWDWAVDSRSIIEAHGGQLVAEPNPGGGTIFRFTLPAAGVADGA